MILELDWVEFVTTLSVGDDKDMLLVVLDAVLVLVLVEVDTASVMILELDPAELVTSLVVGDDVTLCISDVLVEIVEDSVLVSTELVVADPEAVSVDKAVLRHEVSQISCFSRLDVPI